MKWKEEITQSKKLRQRKDEFRRAKIQLSRKIRSVASKEAV